MDILPIVLGLAAGICIGTGIIYLFIGLRRRDDERLHLTFALFSLAYAGANITALLEYKTTSLEHFLQIGNWTALFTGLALIFLLWFVAIYTQVQPRIFLVVLTAVITLVVTIAIIRPNSIHSEIFGIVPITLPWGETINLLDASESIWGMIFFLSEIALVGFTVYACVRQYLSGERQKAFALGLGLAFLLFALIFDIIFIDSGKLNFVFLGDYGFLPLAIVMGIQLANQVLETEDELSEYRQNLESMVEERTEELEQSNLQLTQVITSRQDAEAALRQSERRARALLNAPPDTAMLLSPEGIILEINEIGAERLGLRVEKSIGTNAFELFEPSLAELRWKKLEESLASKLAVHWEDERDGKHYANNFYPILDENEDVISLAVFAADITERVRAEEALQESEEKFRSMVEQSHDGITLFDEQGMIVKWNHAQEQLTGVERAEVIGQYAWDVQFQALPELERSPERHARFKAALQQYFETGQAPWLSQLQEASIRRADGTLRVIQQLSFSIKTTQGFMLGAINRDITERKRAEQVLNRRVEELAALNQIAQMVTTMTDLPAVLGRVSQVVIALFEACFTAIVLPTDGENETMFMHGCDRETGLLEPSLLDPALTDLPLFRQALSKAEPQADPTSEVLSQLLPPVVLETLASGSLQSLMLIPLVMRGDAIGFMFVATDQASRSYTVDDVSLAETIAGDIASAVENTRLFEQAQSVAVAKERSRLARDLHDAVTQTIYSASLIAEVLPTVWERNPMEGQRNLVKLRQLVRGALGEMRTLLFELRPASLEAAELTTLLHHLGDALTGRARIPVSYQIVEKNVPPVEVKIGIYRITQEAFNNIAKHSEATQVTVELQSDLNQVKLTVRDDGRGFDQKNVAEDKLGIQIMTERAHEIDARLDLISSPGNGTQISVTWPGEEYNNAQTLD